MEHHFLALPISLILVQVGQVLVNQLTKNMYLSILIPSFLSPELRSEANMQILIWDMYSQMDQKMLDDKDIVLIQQHSNLYLWMN